MEDPHAINIYTDGSACNTPRRGGIGIVIKLPESLGGHSVELPQPGYQGATISQMELFACITALQFVPKIHDSKSIGRVIIHTDSLYVKDNYQRAIFEWSTNQWKNKNGDPIRHAELWKELINMGKKIQKRVDIQWIKGHSDNQYNRTADRLAKQSANLPNNILRPSMVRRKISLQKTCIGSVIVSGQRIKIRIISGEYEKIHKLFYYRYEVVSKTSNYFQCVDCIWSQFVLRPGHVFVVRIGGTKSFPRVTKVYGEIIEGLSEMS
ncbi:MAG: ribonuclease H [Candidatus Kerfeldbacteria bacterium]